jgi:EmrB/QacA subfamily drug resistance transporter
MSPTERASTHPVGADDRQPAAGSVPAQRRGHHLHRPQHPHHPDPHAAPAQHEPRQTWSVMALALVAQVLVVLDISVVNASLPTIGRSLHLASSDLPWVITAYLLTSGGGLLLGGRISDLLSRKRVFLTGMAVFTTASLLSGFAGSAGMLIGARAAQGLGAALMTPAALSIITTTYSGAQRARGLALWGAVGSMSVAAGVLLGGALTTWTSWRLIFWVNVPIGIVALLAGARLLPIESTTRARLGQFDVPGAATAIGGLAALMFALGRTAEHGWGSASTISALAVSAVLLTAFARIETRAARPLVPPHTWKVKTLVSGTTVMLGVTGLLVATVYLCSIFLQTVLGFSALAAGLSFLPMALTLAVGTHVAAKALQHVAPRVVAATGMCVAALGVGLLATADATSSYAGGVLPGLMIFGLGAGLVFVSVSVTAMHGIPAQHAGLASGFLMTGHEVGAALGVAVLSAVATTAGSLTDSLGAANASSRGFTAAAILAVGFAVVSLWRMPATRVAPGAGGHLH